MKLEDFTDIVISIGMVEDGNILIEKKSGVSMFVTRMPEGHLYLIIWIDNTMMVPYRKKTKGPVDKLIEVGKCIFRGTIETREQLLTVLEVLDLD